MTTRAASTSAWIWEPTYSMYYNPSTRVWATVDLDGGWKYSDSTNEEGAGQSGVLEEGEVQGDNIPEEQIWPGDEEDEEGTRIKDLFKNAPLLRLVVEDADSNVLPQEQKIAVLDPAEPVSIGRDRSHDRRIRLKEMAISKIHATLFWAIDEDAENGGYWAVVDNGSTHGTWIKGDGEKRETRLSESKVASVPSRLHHFDTLRCGSTAFTVHIHSSFACSSCTVASDSSNIIPLLPPTPESNTTNPIPSAYHTKTKEEKEFERREQLKGLKDKLLKPSKPTSFPTPVSSAPSKSGKSASVDFVDRAAARRARDAGILSSKSSSSKPSKLSPSPFFSVPGVTSSSTFTSPSSSSIAMKPDPFSSSSKGAQLLSKLSGPSTSSSPLGAPRPGLGTLIEAKTFEGGGRDVRPGLGSQTLVGIDKVGDKRDWREDVREKSRKRFREMG